MPVARKNVTAELDLEASIGRTAAYHAISVDAVHRLVGQDALFADRRAEEGASAILANASRGKVLVDEGFQLVMRGIEAFEQPPGLVLGQHRGFAAAHDVFGPRAWAGLTARTWPTTSQSKSIRMAARCNLTVGLAAVACTASI